MLAASWEAPEQLRLVELPEPRAADGEAVIEVARCGICGSDLHSFRSGFFAKPGQVLGHEFSGTIVEAPGCPELAPGTRVTARPLIPCGRCRACLAAQPQLCEAGGEQNIGYARHGAFAERVLVPRAVVGQTVFPLPDSVDDRAGALVEPLAVGLHAVRQAEARQGQLAVVLGAGTIGLAVVSFLRLAGVEHVLVADPSPLRREAARGLGADAVVDPLAEELRDAVAARGVGARTGAGGDRAGAAGGSAAAGARGPRADVVIDCAGAAGSLGDALAVARPGGIVVLCAMYARRLELSPDRLTGRELTLRGSFAYSHEFPDVIDALAGGRIDADAFISHELALREIERAFRIQADAGASLKVLVAPRG